MTHPVEGDFDIYGEEEGFEVAQQHHDDQVRPLPLLSQVPLSFKLMIVVQKQELEAFEEDPPMEGEKVSTLTSNVEPSIGDKRPREDDSEQHHANQPPASRSPQSSGSSGNGASYAPMMVMQTGGGSGQGYDALYLGDLQWVRSFLVVKRSLCITHERLRINLIFFFFGYVSGPLTRICVKLQ